jgi:hypothetical protein
LRRRTRATCSMECRHALSSLFSTVCVSKGSTAALQSWSRHGDGGQSLLLSWRA